MMSEMFVVALISVAMFAIGWLLLKASGSVARLDGVRESIAWMGIVLLMLGAIGFVASVACAMVVWAMHLVAAGGSTATIIVTVTVYLAVDVLVVYPAAERALSRYFFSKSRLNLLVMMVVIAVNVALIPVVDYLLTCAGA